jgi:hypothetical protein
MGYWKLLCSCLLFVFLLLFGIYSQWSTTITPDAAMHAEIVVAIKEQGFIMTWEPYADNEYTYPPLFHYIAILLPLEPIDSARVLGMLVWLVLPVALYGLVATYRRDAAFIAAALIGLVPSFSNVFIYGEFPQLMAMVFLLLEWRLLRQGKITWAAIVTGLIVLTHVFFALVGLLFFGYYCVRKREWRALIGLAVALPWLPAYGTVVQNALSGGWENVRYNAIQPVFGFWPMQVSIDWLVGIEGLTPVLLPLAIIGFWKVKDVFLRCVFVFALVFTMFHIPFTQLKIFDFLAIPVVILASIALVELPTKRAYRNAIIVALVVCLAFVQGVHFWNTQVNWFNPEIAPTTELADAAEWLARYDPSFVRMYAHQASAWTGVLAHKLPLNPDITHLERFSDEYREQLAVQKEIKETLIEGRDVQSLLHEHDIRYLIIPFGLGQDLELLYSNGVWGVYR